MTYYVLDLLTETVYEEHTSAVRARTQAVEMGPAYIAVEPLARDEEAEK